MSECLESLGRPTYSFPAGIDDVPTASRLLHDWALRLDAVLALPPGMDDPHIQRDLASYCNWLVFMLSHRPDGRWSLLANYRMPGDAVTDFVKRPTCIALATLVAVRRRHPEVANDVRELDEAIDKASRAIERRRGLGGNGYGRNDAMGEFIRLLARGGVIAFWYENAERYPQLVDVLHSLRDRMTSDPDRWCGHQAGYYAISQESLLQCVRDLDPFQELAETDLFSL